MFEAFLLAYEFSKIKKKKQLRKYHWIKNLQYGFLSIAFVLNFCLKYSMQSRFLLIKKSSTVFLDYYGRMYLCPTVPSNLIMCKLSLKAESTIYVSYEFRHLYWTNHWIKDKIIYSKYNVQKEMEYFSCWEIIFQYSVSVLFLLKKYF